jgi:hypothetical protein
MCPSSASAIAAGHAYMTSIYHLPLPLPTRSMQAVMQAWKAMYVHRNPLLLAAIIISAVNARKY